MAMPPRLHVVYWPRLLPRTIAKTCLCVLGLLLWLLYFYSNNYIYERRSVQGHVRSPADGAPLWKLANSHAIKTDAMASNDASVNVSTLDCRRELPRPIAALRRGDYVVLPELLPARVASSHDESITLTTHATYELLDNLIELSRRWAGPISVAVYAPHTDFRTSVEYALWLRKCHATIADHATFHFVFPAPIADGWVTETGSSDDGHWNDTVTSRGIEAAAPIAVPNHTLCATVESVVDSDVAQVVQSLVWDPANVTADPDESCEAGNFPLPQSYRHRHGLPYPINVCRNVARLNAKTRFVLASDIELYPSNDVIPMFLKLGKQLGLVQKPDVGGSTGDGGGATIVRTATSALTSLFLHGSGWQKGRRVFVLPIFEVDKMVKEVPGDKHTLVSLYRQKKAVYFHKHVCSFCNIIPRLNRWLTTPVPKGKLNIFMTIKRHKPFNRWEPIYIGTNDEPLYDERLTWEGQQDKMTQMYELCLMNYDLAILDNAFLVHRPGIKTKNVTEYNARLPFITQNNKFYGDIIHELHKKHGANIWCK